jgi:hypothetical protein
MPDYDSGDPVKQALIAQQDYSIIEIEGVALVDSESDSSFKLMIRDASVDMIRYID